MKNEIILYRPNVLTGDLQTEAMHIEVRFDEDTAWLTQAQIAELFGTKRQAITRHLRNIFACRELDEDSVCSILELTAADGKKYNTKIYNLDAILSVGYRVNSVSATFFRRWATAKLKDYLLKGYAINTRMNRIEDNADVLKSDADVLKNRVDEIELQINMRNIPAQGVLFDGQIFDAYELASRIIRSAKQNIILIDNYIDESTLTHLAKKNTGVKILLLTQAINPELALDVQKANAQYRGFKVKQFTKSHDRFLIIDSGNEVYHIGASLKDLGKRWFAFQKMNKESVDSIIAAISELI
ncbi:MAG: virulence RhuM family protein [Oscillospiraceae bacterium]|nr:virulence RhuM family protein [Oscillospiraceae bacterium]